MHLIKWLSCFVLFGVSSLALAENLAVHNTYKLLDATLVLDSVNPKTLVVQGDWRFSENPNSSVSELNFASLTPLNPITGNFYYLGFQHLPEQGVFFLKIQADRDQEIAIIFGGLVAESHFTLQHGENSSIVYTSPSHLTPKDQSGRVQIPYPFFSVKVTAGISFLGYHYKQKFQRKGACPITDSMLE